MGRLKGPATKLGSADGCALTPPAAGNAEADADGGAEVTGTADTAAAADAVADVDAGVGACTEVVAAACSVAGRSPPRQAVTPALTLANANSAGTNRSAGNHC